MIYLSDDYLTKYQDVLAYLLGRSYSEGYSFDYIEKNIAYSHPIFELEKSNITTIAFSSLEKIYSEVFPFSKNKYVYDEYNIFAWCGYAYIHLFIKMQLTFEALFYIVPFSKMMDLYHLYHEMNILRLDDYVSETLKYSILDIVMKKNDVSCNRLSSLTGLSFSTINALRYNKRDISRLEADMLLKIANTLHIKMETLLPSINLVISK